jgi:nucleoside-diphosphate-sugar epimerase
VSLRSATAYGASPRLRCDIVLNNLTAWAVATGRVFIKSDGTPWRPIVHVQDICRAFLAALRAPRDAVHGEAFNVARPAENYRISELAAIVEATVPGCEIEFAGDAGPDTRNYRVDASKIARLLPEFEPSWTANAGAGQLYAAFAEHGITLDDIEGWRFRRLGQIKRLMDSDELGPDLRWKS